MVDKVQMAYDRARLYRGQLVAELKKKFPENTKVAFLIHGNQKNPSTGVVIGYDDNGYLHVRHDQARKYSRYSVRNVFFQNAQVLL